MPIPNANDIPPAPDDDLDDPIPLSREVEIPPFPVKSLPEPIAAMVDNVAEATQTDPAMAGTSAITALSACTGGHAEIEIRPGWREPLNLYAVTVAHPGERKSAVQQAMSRCLLDVEQDLADASGPARTEALLQKQVQAMAAERAKQAAAKAAGTDQWAKALADAQGAQSMADDITVPTVPRLLADDITPEAAGTLLAEQNGRLAIISAEGGLFDIIAGRYTAALNMDVWLKGHAGDPLKIDRKGRPPEYIRKPALTVGLMIQPSVLDVIAANRQFRGRGLLARFLYAFPQSKVGRRVIAAAPVNEEVQNAYDLLVTNLAAGMSKWADDRAVLTLTPTAQEAIQAIETAVEPALAGDGDLAALADWGAKYVGAIARIAGIIHLADIGSEKGPRTAVTAESVLAAHRLGDYYRACAIKAFTAMGTDRSTADAEYLLDRIRHLGAEEVSERDMQRAAKRFKSREELLPAVDRLVDHGWLIPLPPPAATGGRPASRRYRVTVTKGQK